MVPKTLVVLFVAVSALGFLDATFLTVKYYSGGPIPCALATECETVTTSRFASIAGVPISLLGALYYGTLFVLSLIYLSNPSKILLTVFTRGTIIGILVSAWLIYLQLFVLQALCFYCILSAGSSTVLFILASIMYALTARPAETFDYRRPL